MRRRPLLRAAAVGGGAYAMGKRRARAEDDAAYDEQQQAADAAPAPSGLSTDAMAELEKLADLKDKGILTQSEFDEQKAKILDAS